MTTTADIRIEPLRTTHDLYPMVERLMIETFPPCERRPTEQQREYADAKDSFSSHAVLTDGCFAGLINLWEFDTFTYIEHFAMLPHLRNCELGSKVLSLIGAERPIVLEAELPTDSLTCRRIAFYERNGFHRLQTSYTQPSYAEGLEEVEMTLMVRGLASETADEAQKIVNTLRTQVYNTSQI